MNEIKLMKEAFSFLLENGYAVSVGKSNIECCVTYTKSDEQIILSYDFREHQFDVGIRNVNGSINYIAYSPLLEMDFGDAIGKGQLIDALNVLYHDAEKDCTTSKKHFYGIVNAYAKYVKNNLSEIMTYF